MSEEKSGYNHQFTNGKIRAVKDLVPKGWELVRDNYDHFVYKVWHDVYAHVFVTTASNLTGNDFRITMSDAPGWGGNSLAKLEGSTAPKFAEDTARLIKRIAGNVSYNRHSRHARGIKNPYE